MDRKLPFVATNEGTVKMRLCIGRICQLKRRPTFGKDRDGLLDHKFVEHSLGLSVAMKKKFVFWEKKHFILEISFITKLAFFL
jgi:hypothetical protein